MIDREKFLQFLKSQLRPSLRPIVDNEDGNGFASKAINAVRLEEIMTRMMVNIEILIGTFSVKPDGLYPFMDDEIYEALNLDYDVNLPEEACIRRGKGKTSRDEPWIHTACMGSLGRAHPYWMSCGLGSWQRPNRKVDKVVITHPEVQFSWKVRPNAGATPASLGWMSSFPIWPCLQGGNSDDLPKGAVAAYHPTIPPLFRVRKKTETNSFGTVVNPSGCIMGTWAGELRFQNQTWFDAQETAQGGNDDALVGAPVYYIQWDSVSEQNVVTPYQSQLYNYPPDHEGDEDIAGALTEKLVQAMRDHLQPS